jgi:MFS family permease
VPPAPASAPRTRLALDRTTAFWLLGTTLSLLLFASSAPSPLYIVFQAEWGFSAITLTSVFAVYAFFLLGTLLVAGSVSDHAGRRPTLLVALAVELVAMLLFAEAQGVGWLFAARALQGVATGLAMGAISAALLDLQPAEHPRLGPLVGVAAPMTGLSIGALVTGLLVEHGPDPTRLVFFLLLGAFALVVPLVAAIPETVDGDGCWRQALRPHISVPRELRGAFLAAVPSLTATWALGGLILSLGPSLTAGVLGEPSHVAGGLPIFIMAGISAIASVVLRDVPARQTARGGLIALIVGIALALLALRDASSGLFLAGTAVAGLGFGPAFGGVFASLTPRAPAAHRAAFVSAILAVSYLAFSVPAVVAGVAVTRLGLYDTADSYGLVLIALAGVALALTRHLREPQAAV